MMDRIGVHSEAYSSHAGMNTFSLLQQAALDHIKESIALVRESKAPEESAMQVISGVVGANA